MCHLFKVLRDPFSVRFGACRLLKTNTIWSVWSIFDVRPVLWLPNIKRHNLFVLSQHAFFFFLGCLEQKPWNSDATILPSFLLWCPNKLLHINLYLNKSLNMSYIKNDFQGLFPHLREDTLNNTNDFFLQHCVINSRWTSLTWVAGLIWHKPLWNKHVIWQL